MDQNPAYISPYQVALGAVVIIVNASISLSMKLGIEWQLAVGALRQVSVDEIPIWSSRLFSSNLLSLEETLTNECQIEERQTAHAIVS